jgi:hypothetical protein
VAEVAKLPQGETAAPARFHDKATWPFAIGLTVAAVVALLVSLGAWGPALIDGCDAATKHNVEIGELRLGDGKVAEAMDIGTQAVATAPRCHCAHLLLAEVGLFRMHQAERLQDQAAFRQARLDCYIEAKKSISLSGETSAKIDALLRACSATSIKPQADE